MTDKAYLDWLEEELARGKSMPVGRILLVAVAVAAALVLVLGVARSRAGSPTGRPTSVPSPAVGVSAPSLAGPLVPGSPTGYRLGTYVVYTAELDNASDAKLTVEYPIQLPGARAGSATVRYADLTEPGRLINFNTPPRRLLHIPAHGSVSLQIGLQVRCRSQPLRAAWPSGDSRIAIELAGYPTAAVFTFADVFGFDFRGDLHRACAPAARAGDR
jgi:hypothetical protein